MNLSRGALRPAFTIPQVSGSNPHSEGALTWLRDSLRHRGVGGSLRYYGRELVDMLRDLTPERRKSRYGDIDFDFEHSVDTTWATVSLRTRVREWLSGGQYQPSEPALFREIIGSLPVTPDGFTFIDLGSGKGRTLLMASSFPFRRIIGMELLEELNGIALQNIARYHSDEQRCFAIESHAGDARTSSFLPIRPCCTCSIRFPGTSGARYWRICTNPVRDRTAPVFVIYHNPVHEDIPNSQGWLHEIETDTSVRDLRSDGRRLVQLLVRHDRTRGRCNPSSATLIDLCSSPITSESMP